MALTVNTNPASLFAQNSLANNQNLMAQAVQRISSGIRINSARDGGTDLAVSQSLMSQIVGANQGIYNLSNATNLLQTADSGLSTIQDALLRMKQLSVQGMDPSIYGVNNAGALSLISQLKDLNSTINTVASNTVFNGVSLLASGPLVDSVNSKIVSGTSAVNVTAIAVAAGGLLTGASTFNDASNNGYTISAASLNPSNTNYHQLPGTYTLQASGNKLILTGTVNGVQQTPDYYSLSDVAVGSTSVTGSQTINFANTGISFVVAPSGTTTGLAASGTGTALAAKIATATPSFTVNGQSAAITSVNLSGAAAGIYTLANPSGANLTLTNNLTGANATTALPSSVTTNTPNLINFSSLGVQLQAIAYPGYSGGANQTYTGSQFAAALAGINGGASQLTLISSGTASLQFPLMSSASSVLQVNTSNVLTNSYGSTPMATLGNMITDASAGDHLLGSFSSTTSSADLQTGFTSLATAVDTAISYISTKRAGYGSLMNSVSYEVNNLQSQSVNLQSAKSAIVDTNFATETANLTKLQIMQQAGVAILAQANQNPSLILQLLKSPSQQMV
jgi:flagellin